MNLSGKNCCLGHERPCEECQNMLSKSLLPLSCLFRYSDKMAYMRLALKNKLFLCPNSTKGCAKIFKYSQKTEAKAHLESCQFINLEEPNNFPSYMGEINSTTQNKLNWSDEQNGNKERFQRNFYEIFQKTIQKTKWINGRWCRSFGESNI